MAMAGKVCDALMLAIKTSQLDFVIQETYSSFVTIRKNSRKVSAPAMKLLKLIQLITKEVLTLQDKYILFIFM